MIGTEVSWKTLTDSNAPLPVNAAKHHEQRGVTTTVHYGVVASAAKLHQETGDFYVVVRTVELPARLQVISVDALLVTKLAPTVEDTPLCGNNPPFIMGD